VVERMGELTRRGLMTWQLHWLDRDVRSGADHSVAVAFEFERTAGWREK